MTITGCRPSPVLEQIVYQQDEEIDKENDSIDDTEQNDNQDDNLPPDTQVAEAETQTEQTQQDAVSGDGQSNTNNTYAPTYQDGANSNGQSGTSANTDTTNSQGDNNSEQQDGGQEPSGSGEQPSEGGNGQEEGGEPSGTDPTPADNPDVVRQIVDARGVTVDIPKDVDSVTAVGEAATVVAMLGGNGRLMGSSVSFVDNNMANVAFDLSSVAAWWDADGSGNISGGNFQALLEAKPQVCFEISGQTSFSSDQIAALDENGIAYVVLPSFSSLQNIKDAVYIVGQVLGDRTVTGGTNAPAIANDYINWTDTIISRAPGRGYTSTIFVSAWDDSAYWEIKNSVNGIWQTGYGMAIAGRPSGSALTDCMNTANVADLTIGGYYINPLRNNYWLHYVSGGSGMFSYGYNMTYNTSAGCGLGNAAFPAVIVSDSYIADKIRNDFHWGVYDWINDEVGNMAIGFSDGSGHIIGTTIEGNYGIYINPSGGMGSWIGGSVESPLEAAWLSCKFNGGYSMDELREIVTDFYSRFYHLNVNAGDILGE